MKRPVALFLASFLLIPLFCCDARDTIESPMKHIWSNGDTVLATGRWKRVTSTSEFTKIARINTVSIFCDKGQRTCWETVAEVVTPEELKGFKTKQLMANEITYEVVEWSSQTVYARCAAFAADIELRISVKDAFAERRFRETKARGSETSNPSIYVHWILE